MQRDPHSGPVPGEASAADEQARCAIERLPRVSPQRIVRRRTG